MVGGRKMKNIIKIFIASVFLFILVPSVAYASDTVISVGNTSGTMGDTVKIPINISGNTGISSYGFIFEYDNEYLTPISAENGVWDRDIIFNPNYAANQVFATGAATSNKTGDGAFIYIKFKIKKDISSDGSTITLKVKQLKHLEGTVSSDLSYTIKSGIITAATTEKIEIGFKDESYSLIGLIKVPIEIKNNLGISTFGICINYDSNYLTPVSVDKGIWDSEIIFNPNYADNQAFVTGASAFNKTGDGKFMYINFKANKISNATTSLKITVKQLKTAEGATTKNISYLETNGNISLSVDKSVYDIDKNGTINRDDAKIILEYVLNNDIDKFNIGKYINGKLIGDIDADGKITASDASFILWLYDNL